MTVDLALAPTSNTSGLGLGLEDLWPWPWPRRLLALALASTMLSSNTSLVYGWSLDTPQMKFLTCVFVFVLFWQLLFWQYTLKTPNHSIAIVCLFIHPSFGP